MFNEKLRYLCKYQELTQSELAEHLNINSATYSKYEQGITEPDIATIKKLANFFDVSIDYLLENENVIADREDVVDLNNFLLKDRYTIHSRFPKDKERKLLHHMVDLIFEYREREEER